MAQFVIYAIVFLVGAYLVRNGTINFSDLMVCQFSILFGAYGAGMANQYMGDIGKAKNAAKKIQEEIYETSKIEVDPDNPNVNPTSNAFKKPELSGKIKFVKVYFKYKGSKNWILKNLNFEINANEAYALVGGSGSGKSTVL